MDVALQHPAISAPYLKELMTLRIPAGLMHATRLVRGGDLIGATAAIQRALRGEAPAPAHKTTDTDDVPIEGQFRVVDVNLPAPPPVPFVKITPHTPGQFLTRSHTNAAGTREYRIYIPAAYHGQALPLVVMLHGCKQGPDDFAAATRMNSLAEEHGFIVVYPKQTGKANGSNCWNWFQAKHQQRDRGEPSLIAGITREVLTAYALDTRRVYVAGLSAGGAMAAIMGTTYPDLYAAVGIHSGLAYAAAGDVPSAFAAMRGQGSKRGRRKARPDTAARSVPMIVFHGGSDTTVHPSNGDDLIAQASPQPSTQKAGERPFTEHERSVEQGDVRGRAYTRTTYRDSAGKPVMEQWLVHGAAHAWCGGSAEGSFSDPAGPDASREMLRFFLQQQN